MITASQILSEIMLTREDIKELQERQRDGSIWDTVQGKLDEIVDLIKRDMKIFGYN